MALLLMVEYLSEVSHIDHLTARLTRVEMVSLVVGLSVHPVADNLPRLDHSSIFRVLDAVSCFLHPITRCRILRARRHYPQSPRRPVVMVS